MVTTGNTMAPCVVIGERVAALLLSGRLHEAFQTVNIRKDDCNERE
jgi:hypothetical protein